MSATEPASGPGIWGKEATLSMGTGIPSTGQMSPDHLRKKIVFPYPDPHAHTLGGWLGSLQVHCTDGKLRLGLHSLPTPILPSHSLLSCPGPGFVQ